MNWTCQTTDVPLADDIDMPTLREKYRLEREKRLRREGGEQYLSAEGEFADAYAHDPWMDAKPRDAVIEEIEVAILGAGFSGLLAGVHLRNAGLTDIRHIDHAGDFGGVWYWNRYPGIQCDNDALCYLPLLEETGAMPSKQIHRWAREPAACSRIAEQYRSIRKGACSIP